jgi:hypothetical protein
MGLKVFRRRLSMKAGSGFYGYCSRVKGECYFVFRHFFFFLKSKKALCVIGWFLCFCRNGFGVSVLRGIFLF